MASQYVTVAPSVLQCRDERILTDERGGELCGRVRVVALDEEQHEVDRPDLLRVAHGCHAHTALLSTAPDDHTVGPDPFDHRHGDVNQSHL